MKVLSMTQDRPLYGKVTGSDLGVPQIWLGWVLMESPGGANGISQVGGDLAMAAACICVQ